MNELIYIVDNESAITLILSEILTGLGYKTKCFAHPIEALEFIIEDSPKVIISDFKMPEMHGIDFLKQVQKINLDTSFILFSAFLTKEVAAEAIKNGAFGLMDKPFKENVLRSFVDNAINNNKHKEFLNSKISLIDDVLVKNENTDVNDNIKQILEEIKNHKIHFKMSYKTGIIFD